jgi:hypothetical protein
LVNWLRALIRRDLKQEKQQKLIEKGINPFESSRQKVYGPIRTRKKLVRAKVRKHGRIKTKRI